MNPRSGAITGMWSTTRRLAAWISVLDHACCFYGARRTGIRHNSTIPTNSGWIARAARATSVLAHFCIGAALARLEARIVIGQLLERTTHFETTDTGRWLKSLLSRRLERLELEVA